jgi:hypothetical protein
MPGLDADGPRPKVPRMGAPDATEDGPREESSRRIRLYVNSVPIAGLNRCVVSWLKNDIATREHGKPAAFDEMRNACDLEVEALLEDPTISDEWAARKQLLSRMTDLMFGDDISGRLMNLSSDRINPAGFRSALSQSVAKNTGENFINSLVYVLASALADQDEILVDKGVPPPLKPLLMMNKTFTDKDGKARKIDIKIEVDFAIWRRSDPTQAIVVNAKTRLKEVFHIGTMWKLLYDILGDPYCQQKWGLTVPDRAPDMLYVFATADMIRSTGTNSQGADVERKEVRNLIAMDASFFDYVFVSKTGIDHVANELVLERGREALFHEMGCLLDLITQKFPDCDLKLDGVE